MRDLHKSKQESVQRMFKDLDLTENPGSSEEKAT